MFSQGLCIPDHASSKNNARNVVMSFGLSEPAEKNEVVWYLSKNNVTTSQCTYTYVKEPRTILLHSNLVWCVSEDADMNIRLP